MLFVLVGKALPTLHFQDLEFFLSQPLQNQLTYLIFYFILAPLTLFSCQDLIPFSILLDSASIIFSILGENYAGQGGEEKRMSNHLSGQPGNLQSHLQLKRKGTCRNQNRKPLTENQISPSSNQSVIALGQAAEQLQIISQQTHCFSQQNYLLFQIIQNKFNQCYYLYSTFISKVQMAN